MKRQNLRLKLAEAIEQVLTGHACTIPNATRYCTRDVLASFSIRRTTEIGLDDWQTAIDIVKLRRAKPIVSDPKRISTPSQLRDPSAWKQPYLKRIKEIYSPSLERDTRIKMLLEAPNKEVWGSRLRTWKAGLLATEAKF